MTEQNNKEGKRLTALNGQLIVDVTYSTYKYMKNSWGYRAYVRLPDDYQSRLKHHEIEIDGARYVVIYSKDNFNTRSEAVAAAILKLAELTNTIRQENN